MPCPYANILGIPKTGVHSIRIFGFATVDILLTILAAHLTARSLNINFWLSLLVWFVSGEILHYVFGVRTAFLEKIGINIDCS